MLYKMSNNAQIYIAKIGIYSKLAVGSKKVQNVINSVALQIVLYLFRNWSDASYDDLLDACTSNSIKLLIYDHFGCTYNSLNKFDCLSYVNSSVKLSIESSELRLLKPFFYLFTKNLAALAILNSF